MRFNGTNCSDLGVEMVAKPDIPASQRNIETIVVPGRHGALHKDNGTYGEIKLPVEFNFIGKKDEWYQNWRKIKSWLQGTGKLEFKDDVEGFYKVSYVTLNSAEHSSHRIGTFTAEFICEPFFYLNMGQYWVENPSGLHNGYYEAYPIYQIEGEGMCTLAVNGKEIVVNVGQDITIDTALQIAYKSNGSNQNSNISGRYENLYLAEGNNEISVSEGFILRIKPEWRML